MRTLALILLATLGGGGLDGVIEGTERPGDVAWENAHPGADGVVELGPAPIFELTGTNGTTATDGTTPTTATRASSAYRTDWDGSKHTLTLVGTNVIRVGSYNDGTTTRNAVQIEGAATNLLTYSEDFGNAAWTELDGGDTLGTGIATPDPSKTSDALVADSTNGTHGFTQAVTTTAASHALSVYAKAGAEDWLYLSNDTVTNATAYFNLSTGAVGTEGAAGTGYIEGIGDAWYRCVLVFTATAASNTMRIAAATADGDNTFAGDGAAITTHVFGAQLETGAYASSYIPTTSASATRAAETLEYPISLSSYPYTVQAHFVSQSQGVTRGIVALSDGGLTADRMLLYSSSGTNLGLFVAAAEPGGANITGGTLGLNQWYSSTAVMDLDNTSLFLDGALLGSDLSVTPPNDIDQLHVGTYQSEGNHWNGLIGLPLRIYDQVVDP